MSEISGKGHDLLTELMYVRYDLNSGYAEMTYDEAADYIAALEDDRRRFDLIGYIISQREWSEKTFGPGERTVGIVDHIKKELKEIEADPLDLAEWIDVIILALDGAWRAGHSPEEIAQCLSDKQAKNRARKWPDWRTAEEGKAIEHIREQSDGH